MTAVRASLRLSDLGLWRHEECAHGMRDMARIMPGMIAWAVVTGMAMAKSGMSLSIAVLMSLTVFGASAQLAAVPLMVAGAPLWVVWMTAFCVNLRFVIFSVQVRPHMMCLPLRWRLLGGYLTADVVYVLLVNRHPPQRPASEAHRAPLAYFLGLAFVHWAGWHIAALCGILFATAIPAHWGLGFAGTLALLGLLVSLAKDKQTLLTAGLAGTAAVACFALPYRLYIVVAVAAAIACGLLLDQIVKSSEAGEDDAAS
jgi:predicted branched-subunit amino acid permease